MKLEDLKPGGLYRITRATPNPNRDRRVNSEWVRMDLPEGGELLCTFRRDHGMGPEMKSQTIELSAYNNKLAGAGRYASRALIGWQFDDGRTKQRMSNDQDDSYGRFVDTLLSVIEPFEPRDVDDALAVFNATHRPEISYEHVALTLLDESAASTLEAFERTRVRLERFDAETGEDHHEWNRRFAEFNAKAYKPASEPAGDPAPLHTFKLRGETVLSVECEGCGSTFLGDRAGLPNPVAGFAAHLPCKGRR